MQNNKNQIISKEQIYNKVWGIDNEIESNMNDKDIQNDYENADPSEQQEIKFRIILDEVIKAEQAVMSDNEWKEEIVKLNKEDADEYITNMLAEIIEIATEELTTNKAYKVYNVTMEEVASVMQTHGTADTIYEYYNNSFNAEKNEELKEWTKQFNEDFDDSFNFTDYDGNGEIDDEEWDKNMEEYRLNH